MAVIFSKNTKRILITISTIIIVSVIFIYRKITGGEAQNLPENKFIVSPSQESSTSEQKSQMKVAVAYAQTPAQGIQEVISQTGNLDFIEPGQKILIKPNVNSDDPAPGTTHPQALKEVIKLVKEKGGYVIVGDRSNPRWKTIPAMKTTGMYQAAEDAGADEIVGFENEEWVRIKPEKATSWSNGFRIPKRLQDIDHIISVPVLHTHAITGHSLAIKNLVGLIHPADRMIFHSSSKLEEMIAEIGLAIKPSLTIIEGTKAFIDGGPSHGTLVSPKVYLASKDIVTADVIGVELLKKEGADKLYSNPWSSTQVKRSIELNLNTYDKTEVDEEIKKL